MKTLKLIVAAGLLMMLGSSPLFAQEGGIRFGDAPGNKSSVAVDAVFSLGKYSRIHADASFGNGVGIEALYDFLYKPLSDSPFNWYLGAGPSLYLGDPFLLGVAGEAGLEYRFKDVPLVLGADYRPTFMIVQNTDFFGGFGFNVRYVFGKK